MRTPKVLHQMRLLPEPVQAKDAFVRPHAGVRAQVYIDIGFGAQNDSADGTLGLFPRLVHQVEHQVLVGRFTIIVVVIVLLHFILDGARGTGGGTRGGVEHHVHDMRRGS